MRAQGHQSRVADIVCASHLVWHVTCVRQVLCNCAVTDTLSTRAFTLAVVVGSCHSLACVAPVNA